MTGALGHFSSSSLREQTRRLSRIGILFATALQLPATATCSSGTPNEQQGNASKEVSSLRHFCSWPAEVTTSGDLKLKELGATSTTAKEDSEETCRIIESVHRGDSLLISVRSFGVETISEDTLQCIRHKDPILSDRVEASSGSDLIELLSDISQTQPCWESLRGSIEHLFTETSGYSVVVVDPGPALQNLNRRRATSTLTQLGLEDSVARIVPIGVYTSGTRNLQIRCLKISKVVEQTRPPIPSDWVQCLGRLAG